MIHKPKIVMIGGGTGLPEILHGLRDKDVDVTAIVTVADDGGSSGILRNYVNVVPPGDIRNALVALSELSELELEIFQYRFNSTDQFLAGHAIGNLIISALAEMKGGDIFAAVQELSSLMKIRGHTSVMLVFLLNSPTSRPVRSGVSVPVREFSVPPICSNWLPLLPPPPRRLSIGFTTVLSIQTQKPQMNAPRR